MRAIICEEFASPEQLKVTEIPDPEPNDNQVLKACNLLSKSAGLVFSEGHHHELQRFEENGVL